MQRFALCTTHLQESIREIMHRKGKGPHLVVT